MTDRDIEHATGAVADLVGRSAGKEFQIGYLDDDVPSDQARWYAKARWGGEVLMAENQPGPAEACDALARKLLHGGTCIHCHRTVTLNQEPERCHWARVESRWVRGCEAEFPEDNPPSTAQRLTAALQHVGAPRQMVEAALAGYYDDFRSPLPFPLMQLVADLDKLGLKDLAERVRNGDFDATKEESEAWARGPDGQAAFAELLAGRRQPPQPNRAQRRQAKRRK